MQRHNKQGQYRWKARQSQVRRSNSAVLPVLLVLILKPCSAGVFCPLQDAYLLCNYFKLHIFHYYIVAPAFDYNLV